MFLKLLQKSTFNIIFWIRYIYHTI